MSSDSTCPICFEVLSDKIKASPDNCEHIFCLPCLEKWSKLGSYCPVDRKRFKKILNLDSNSVIQVKSHKRKRKRVVYDFTTDCEICSGNSDANVMLLCDCCDLGYHIHCLTPPLKEVPSGLWFCPTCIAVEEKLKKKNGITKEVEAELGGFDNNLLYKNKVKEKVINEKESMAKAKKVDNSTSIKKNTGILETCYDIITEFEDMTVRKNYSKDACSSNYLDSAINKIDKMYKSFDTASQNSTSDHSKNIKTYSVSNTYQKRIKPFDVGKKKKLNEKAIRLNTFDKCLTENNTSSNINLPNHTATADTRPEFSNINVLFDDDVDDDDVFSRNENDKNNSSLYSDEFKLYSETDDNMSYELFENSFQSRNWSPSSPAVQIFENSNKPKSEDMLVIRKNVEESLSRKSLEKNENSEKSLKRRKKKPNRAVIASYAEDSVPSSSCLRNKPSKGTSKNLIQFSVFQRIEGIDASQEICSQISSVDVPLSSNIHLQNCSICNDEIFARSQMQCKVCKLKYFNIKESKRFSNCVKSFKKRLGYKQYENTNMDKMRFELRVLETQKNLVNRSSSVLERRKRSLIHTLKKIHDSKCINTVPVY